MGHESVPTVGTQDSTATSADELHLVAPMLLEHVGSEDGKGSYDRKPLIWPPMDDLSLQAGIDIALDGILNDRLAVLLGAGLSMAPPSNLRSAAAIAGDAKAKYDDTYGNTRPPLASGIEDQAQFFFGRSELATVYLRTYIRNSEFAGRPNEGHYAIADLALVQGIQVAVTTNVDGMVETAGQMLYGQIGAGIDGTSVSALPHGVVPYLKIHGCWAKDRDNTVWAPGQLGAAPVSQRIESSTMWLGPRLLDRDLLIVGYSTDWDYLNQALARVIGAVRPARIVVVNLSDKADFIRKAPDLVALGGRAASIGYVKTSGADFLNELRLQYSRSYIRRALRQGATEFANRKGFPPDPAWLEPPTLDNQTLWLLRRDMEGTLPNQPATMLAPANEPLVGQTVLEIQAAGGTPSGSYWTLGGKTVRVIRTPNVPLHRVQADFAVEMAPTTAPNVVIAVGAENLALPSSVARASSPSSVARGSSITWMTRPQAIGDLAL